MAMMPNAPLYFFDAALGRFRDRKTGRAISSALVRQELDTAIRRGAAEVAALTQQLRSGAIDVAGWRVAMAEQIKMSHLAAAMVAKGGREMMTQADFGRAGAEIKFQYQRLAQFASGIADGSVRLDGRVTARADMYVQAIRGTFHAVERLEAASTGAAFERSILHPADHCVTCVEQAALGWQPIGSMIPIGERQCLTRCRCSVEYKGDSLVAA